MENNPVKKKPDYYKDLKCMPLVDIFGASLLCCGNIDEKPCEIYGRISVINELDDSTIVFFNRDYDNPQTISTIGGSLSLTLSKYKYSGTDDDVAIVPYEEVRLHVELYDRNRNNASIKVAGRALDFTTPNVYDWTEVYKEMVFSGGPTDEYEYEYEFSVGLNVAIYPYAVSANVKVLFFSEYDDFDLDPPGPEGWGGLGYYDDENDNLGPKQCESDDEFDYTRYEENKCSITLRLCGTVSASTAAVNGVVREKPYDSILLFDKPFNDSVLVKSGKFIELSRSVVAVPAYSSLKIDVAFFTGDPVLVSPSPYPYPAAKGIVEFKPFDDMCRSMKEIVGSNGRIRVQVVWSEPYNLVRSTKLQSPYSRASPFSRPSLEHHSRNDRSHTLGHSLEDLCANCISPYDGDVNPLIEVFSVVICRKDTKPFKFHGSITIQNGGRYRIFHREKSCPEECKESGIRLVLGGPCFTSIEDFGIQMDLEDVNGGVISRGVFCTRGVNYRYHGYKRLCGIVRGEVGFAALHYSFFPDGVKAEVEVKMDRIRYPCTVKGKIYAISVYEDKQSRSLFQEKLYEGVLFDGVSERLNSGCFLPLVKTIVSVPRRSSFVIQAELSVSPNATAFDGGVSLGDLPLSGCLIFKSNGDSPQQISKDYCGLQVSVKFSEAY